MMWSPKIGDLYVFAIQQYANVETFGLVYIHQVYPVLIFKKQDNTQIEMKMTPFYSHNDKCFMIYDNGKTYRFVKIENDNHSEFSDRLENLELRSKLQPVSELDLEETLSDHMRKIEVILASATQMVQELYDKLKEKEKIIDLKNKEVDKLQVCLDTQLRCIPNLR